MFSRFCEFTIIRRRVLVSMFTLCLVWIDIDII